MMKMNLFRHYVPLALLSGGLLLSCSHDEFSSGSGVISFSTASNRFSTKISPMVSEDMRTFRVWSYSGMNDGFVPNLDGAEVSRASAADDWVYSPMGEWPPEDTVDFYAVSPADAVAQDDMTPTYNHATFTYTVPAADDQVDLLVVKTDGIDAATHPSPVQLTFAHALSRIGLKVKTDAGGIGAKFKIGDVKLLNVNSMGTYSFIDGTWSGLNNLTDYAVPVDESWSDGKVLTTADSIVIGGDNGLMVLPQTSAAGTYQVDGESPTNGTYLSLKATLVKEGGNNVGHTFYFPVVNNLDDRNPLKFEKGKQYTFSLELQAGSGFNAFQITFSGVTSEPWENGVGALDTKVWAGSNIYFKPDEDGGVVGSLTFIEKNATAEQQGYQGLYFKWGSLIGVAATGTSGDLNAFKEDTYLYIPDLGAGTSEGKYYKVQVADVTDDYTNGNSDMQAAVQVFHTAIGSNMSSGGSTDWDKIPYADDEFTSAQEDCNKSPLTDASNQAYYESYKGDICKFLSDKKENNGSGLTRNWVMPVSNNFSLNGDYTISNTWNNTVTVTATPENGTSVIPDAYYIYTTASDEDVTFPASGYRDYFDGALDDDVGFRGSYWSSSVCSASDAYFLYFYSYVYPVNYDSRAWGHSVRCIQK